MVSSIFHTLHGSLSHFLFLFVISLRLLELFLSNLIERETCYEIFPLDLFFLVFPLRYDTPKASGSIPNKEMESGGAAGTETEEGKQRSMARQYKILVCLDLFNKDEAVMKRSGRPIKTRIPVEQKKK